MSLCVCMYTIAMSRRACTYAIHTFVCVNIYGYLCKCVCVCVCIYVRVFACEYIHLIMCVYICMYIRTYIHIHMYRHDKGHQIRLPP